MSDRRRFLLASGALLAAPRIGRAQQAGRTYAVGVLLREHIAAKQSYRSVVRDRLATHGFVEGRNLRIEQTPLGGSGVGSGREAALRLLEAKVDAILSSSDAITEGAMLATKSVPIVFVWVSDPLLQGVVASLGRPGGNVTGVTSRVAELSQKRFELALELVPAAKRVALVGTKFFWAHYDEAVRPMLATAAQRANVQLLELTWNAHRTIEDAHRAGADVVVTHTNLIAAGLHSNLDAWTKTSIARKLPVIYVGREEVEAGGLISYGTNILEDLQRAADILARVLKGDDPANLPVDQASRFELVINLRTADAIGLKIPQSILVRADRVIE